MRLLLAAIVALSLCCVSARPVAAALTVNGYSLATAGKYDRFENSLSFIGSAYDWSGVGRTSLAGGRWGVLISPSFVLSAAHYPPAVNDTIHFYPNNNPSSVPESRLIASNTTITQTGNSVGSDLLLTRLSAPVTGISTYAIGNPAMNLVGEELFVWGLDNNADQFLNTRLGRNEVTEILPAFSNGTPGAPTGDVFVYDYNTTTGLGPDEARLANYDSGGPSFIVGPDGKLALVGIHWFNYDPDPEVPGSLGGSGDTLVTSFIDELNFAMAATGSLERVTVAVPEPSALGLCALGLSLVCFGRRRRSSPSIRV